MLYNVNEVGAFLILDFLLNKHLLKIEQSNKFLQTHIWIDYVLKSLKVIPY